jgi:hypothetical protein
MEGAAPSAPESKKVHPQISQIPQIFGEENEESRKEKFLPRIARMTRTSKGWDILRQKAGDRRTNQPNSAQLESAPGKRLLLRDTSQKCVRDFHGHRAVDKRRSPGGRAQAISIRWGDVRLRLASPGHAAAIRPGQRIFLSQFACPSLRCAL